MTDSNLRDALAEKHARNREERQAAVKHWAAFIEDNPPEVWGPQQNSLVDSQLESARALDLDAAHYRRIERAGRNRWRKASASLAIHGGEYDSDTVMEGAAALDRAWDSIGPLVYSSLPLFDEVLDHLERGLPDAG